MSRRAKREKRRARRRAESLAKRKGTGIPDRQQVSLIQRQLSVSSFSGPIPPPEILSKYDEICPGAADRLIRMAEKQSAHRQSLESRALDCEHKRSMLGMMCGLVVAISGFAVAAWIAWLGHPWIGVLFASIDIVSLVGVFVYGKRHTAKERRERLEAVAG